MKPLIVIYTSMTFLLSMTRFVLVLSEDHEDQTVRVPYSLHFRHSSAKVTEMNSRQLGQLDQLRQLQGVVLAFSYASNHIMCSMDKRSTVYTDLALERMNQEHPPATYESEDCILTFLNESSFDGITILNGSVVHFHRADHEDLELDLSQGGDKCIARDPEDSEAGRQLRATGVHSEHEHVSALPRMLNAKPALWSDCYPKASSGYKLKIGIAVGSMFQSTFGKNTAAQVQSMVSSVNFIYKNQLNIELVVDHLYTGSGQFNDECLTGIGSQMVSFREWPKPSSQGLWHLIDDCFGRSPGSVAGTAYMRAICRRPKNVGVTYCNGRNCARGFKTLAHEFGHNFGAEHSFEEGRRTTGGIMDYGSGILNGIYQFNSKYRKDEICTELRRVIPICDDFHSNSGGNGGETAATASPTSFPTKTSAPIPSPTQFPTKETSAPSPYPTRFPTQTSAPVPYPTKFPINPPTQYPTDFPQPVPTPYPSQFPQRRRALDMVW